MLFHTVDMTSSILDFKNSLGSLVNRFSRVLKRYYFYTQKEIILEYP